MSVCKIFGRRLLAAAIAAFILWPLSLPAQANDLFASECSLAAVEKLPDAIDRVTDTFDEEVADDFFPLEKGHERISRICVFDVLPADEYTESIRALRITFHAIKSDYRPYVMFWNEETAVWTRVKTEMNRVNKTATADLSVLNGYAAVFVDPRDEYEGIASWYRHARYPNGAATNLFPIGTKLRVTNLETGAHANVRVTSTWTQKNPKRVIDLVSTSFTKIGNPRKGLLRVRIEKL